MNEGTRSKWTVAAIVVASIFVAVMALLIVKSQSFKNGSVNLSSTETTTTTTNPDPTAGRPATIVGYMKTGTSVSAQSLVVVNGITGERLRTLVDVKNPGEGLSIDRAGTVYYSDSDTKTGGIYSVPISGGKAKLVLREATSPSLSPDGKMLAYLSNSSSQSASGALRTFDIANQTTFLIRQPTASNDFFSGVPFWTSDGKKIGIARVSSSPHAGLTFFDTGKLYSSLDGVRQIAPSDKTPDGTGWFGGSALSDGSLIVYEQTAPGDTVIANRILHVAADGTVERTIVDGTSSQLWNLNTATTDGMHVLLTSAPGPDAKTPVPERSLYVQEGERPPVLLAKGLTTATWR